MSDVKVTPTEADREIAARFFNRGGPAHPELAQALADARLQGHWQGMEAAAGWHDRQAEIHAAHQASAELIGGERSAQAHEHRRRQHEADAAAIRNLTPETGRVE
jgi:hypothetical protein